MRFFRPLLYNLLVIFAVAAAFTAGYLYHQRETRLNLPILKEAYQVLDEYGLKPHPTPPGLEYGMIRGMVQAYDDPYTMFLEPPQNELESNRLEGRFGGVGVDLQQDAQGNWLLYPYPDGPAAKAGVLDGDLLLKADETIVTRETSADIVQAALRGPVGDRIHLEVSRRLKQRQSQ